MSKNKYSGKEYTKFKDSLELYLDGATLDDLVAYFTGLKENKYKDCFEVELEVDRTYGYYDSVEIDYYIVGYREKTEKEKEKYKKQLEKAKLNRKKNRAKQEEKEIEQLKKLLEKHGDKI